jgi:ACT domain-containing protein
MTRPDLDPLPGDFDQELENLDPVDVEIVEASHDRVEASHDRQLVVQFTLDGDDAAALQKIAHDQGEKPGEVVRSLIRAASDRAA